MIFSGLPLITQTEYNTVINFQFPSPTTIFFFSSYFFLYLVVFISLAIRTTNRKRIELKCKLCGNCLSHIYVYMCMCNVCLFFCRATLFLSHLPSDTWEGNYNLKKTKERKIKRGKTYVKKSPIDFRRMKWFQSSSMVWWCTLKPHKLDVCCYCYCYWCCWCCCCFFWLLVSSFHKRILQRCGFLLLIQLTRVFVCL